MLIPHGIMVALVDGERFELYRNTGSAIEPKLELLPTPELDAHNRGSGARHQVSSANPSGNLLDEDAHAAAVAGWLNKTALEHGIEKRLVIAATPRTLGELRRHYHVALQAVLAAEIDKDLVGRPAGAILAALREMP